ncbi:hypothetical protein [Halobacterium wangiae]|uniref:hypothetical protein n=1 Tax=Halobacterium wangiae TaxID=2902623 RepID=UPI001E5F3A45|nr:hypothetical protein [Halobacterium wangiae]
MKRRALLGTLAATAFAGCTGYATAPVGDDSTTTEDRTTTGDRTTTEDRTTTDGGETFAYQIDGVETDDPPVEDVTIDVTVERNFTTAHPAVLRVAFTNDAGEEREFAFGSLVPWDGLWGQHEDGTSSLLLAPGDSVVPDEPEENCWQATDGIALPAVMRTETLEPGETVAAEFNVLAAHDSDACIQIGNYRFEDASYLNEGWGFDVQIGAIVEKDEG